MVKDKACSQRAGPTSKQRRATNTKTQCCTSFATWSIGILLLAITINTFLILTVKEPIMTLNKISLNTTTSIRDLFFQPGSNITMIAEVSIDNPNWVTFKFSYTTSTMYYRGVMIGEARGEPGYVQARHTTRMNVTVEIMTQQIMLAPNLGRDLLSGLFSMESFTRLSGNVTFLSIVNKNVVMQMNCSFIFNVTNQEVLDQSCKRGMPM